MLRQSSQDMALSGGGESSIRLQAHRFVPSFRNISSICGSRSSLSLACFLIPCFTPPWGMGQGGVGREVLEVQQLRREAQGCVGPGVVPHEVELYAEASIRARLQEPQLSKSSGAHSVRADFSERGGGLFRSFFLVFFLAPTSCYLHRTLAACVAQLWCRAQFSLI